MNDTVFRFPFSVKLGFILLSLAIIFLALYLGQDILIPILLSFLFAILLRPVVVLLTSRLKFPHVIAVLASVTMFVLIVALLLFFISWQISDIAEDWKKIRHNLSIHYDHAQNWIKERFKVSYTRQQNYVDQVTGDTIGGDSTFMGNTFRSFTDTLFNTILIPIYTFLILLYRNLFKRFLSRIVPLTNQAVLQDTLIHVKTVIQSYVVGLLIEMGVVAALTTGGLMFLGVQYAMLLGIITAILNLIPYIGILLASVITLFATLINSSDVSVIVGVLSLSIIVQFIDNNILVPRIVGNKVRINALVTMIGVIIGGSMAGVAGMFLAIPLIAILKVVFDRIESLSALGYLMGDELPKTFKWRKLRLPDLDHGNSSAIWPEQTKKDIV